MVVLKLKEISMNSLTLSPNQQRKYLSHQTSRFSVFYKLSPLFLFTFRTKFIEDVFRMLAIKRYYGRPS